MQKTQNSAPTRRMQQTLFWALATMYHATATDKLLDSVCGHFASLLQHSDARQRPKAQEISNVIWALAVKQHTLKDGRLLDDFCMCIHGLLQSQDQRARPTSQAVANVMWALAQLQHAPPSEVVYAMLDHLVALCRTPGLQPKSQTSATFSLHVLNSGLVCIRVNSKSC